MALPALALEVFRALNTAGAGLVAWRLWRLGLHRRYRFFFAYLVYSTCRSAALFSLGVKSGAYAKVWIATQPVQWVFYILLVLELYTLALENHKGLYTVGRWFMHAALALSVLISMASLVLAAPGAGGQSRLIGHFLLIDRGVSFSLVLFLLLLLAFLTRYPVPLQRNVLIHSVLYSVYFSSKTAGLFVRTVVGMSALPAVNLFLTGVGAGCMLGWLALLSRPGETRAASLHVPVAPEQEARLVGQLEAINASLLRTMRREFALREPGEMPIQNLRDTGK